MQDITDITWSPSASDCLTIPIQKKAVIMALARSRTADTAKVIFDDVIAGKGRGLNILL